MTQKFKDDARALLAGNISAAATSLTVEAGKADRFPLATTSDWLSPVDWFKAVIIDSAGNREVVKVGTRTIGSGVLGNLQRAQDGTSALAFNAGAVVMLAVCAADVENALAGVYANGITVGGLITQQGVAGRVTPVGGIIMYSGAIAAIPTGWQLCDGTNGTPDLRDKFVIGATADNAGVAQTNVTGALTKSGGSKDAIVPSHTHTAASSFAGNALPAHGHGVNDSGHVHSGGRDGGASGAGPGWGSTFISVLSNLVNVASSLTGISIQVSSAGTPSGSVTTTVNSTGSSATNANLPPYYALAFIMAMA